MCAGRHMQACERYGSGWGASVGGRSQRQTPHLDPAGASQLPCKPSNYKGLDSWLPDSVAMGLVAFRACCPLHLLCLQNWLSVRVVVGALWSSKRAPVFSAASGIARAWSPSVLAWAGDHATVLRRIGKATKPGWWPSPPLGLGCTAWAVMAAFVAGWLPVPPCSATC